MYSYTGNPKANIPTIFVIFGATGDLATKKVMPALFHLFEKGRLPELFKIIGFSHTDLDEARFKTRIADFIKGYLGNTEHESEKINDFIVNVFYQKGSFENHHDYRDLSKFLINTDDNWGLCASKLFF